MPLKYLCHILNLCLTWRATVLQAWKVSRAAGLTGCWRPGWCPRASVSRPERGLVSLGCWPETEWEWKLCRKSNWEQQRHWRQKQIFIIIIINIIIAWNMKADINFSTLWTSHDLQEVFKCLEKMKIWTISCQLREVNVLRKLTLTPRWPPDICTEPCWTGRCLRTVALWRHNPVTKKTDQLETNTNTDKQREEVPEIFIFFTVLLVLLVTWTLTLIGSPW